MSTVIYEIVQVILGMTLIGGSFRIACLLVQMIVCDPQEKASIKKKIVNVLKFCILAAILSSSVYAFRNIIKSYIA